MDMTTKMFIEAIKNNNYQGTESHLKKGGIDLNNASTVIRLGDHGTVLHYAAWKGDLRIVELLLLYNAEINITTTLCGATPLHYAAISDSTGVIEVLLRHQADINKADNYGYTALHHAVKGNTVKATELLIDRGISVNQYNIYGLTALHWAAHWGSTECALILLQRGADATLTDEKGYTALMMARGETTADAISKFIDGRSSMTKLNKRRALSTKEVNTDDSTTDDTMALDDSKDSSPKYTSVNALLSEDKSEIVLPHLAVSANQDSTGIVYTLANKENRFRKLPNKLDIPIFRKYAVAIKGKPTEIKLKDLSRDIGYEWRRIASGLGISYKEQEQIRMDFPLDSQQAIMEMLMRWRARVEDKTEEERCTILKRALKEEGRKDLADSLCTL